MFSSADSSLPEQTDSHDIIVVGAGPAGSHAAWQLARAGWKTLLVERGSRDKAGARWVNGFPPPFYGRTGLTPGDFPEVREKDFRFVVTDAGEKASYVLDPSPVWQVDMRLLNKRLLTLAAEAGVEIRDKWEIRRFHFEGPRLVGADFHDQDRNRDVTRYARLWVDASGNAAVLRRNCASLAKICPPVTPDNTCHAAQAVFEIPEEKSGAARQWADERRVREADAYSLLGVDGGFSTLTIQVNTTHREVELLTGAIDRPPFQNGDQLLNGFVDRHDWVGGRKFGGSGKIPLRRPYDLFVAPGVTLLGNAACQVFPGHASGTAAGLLAGKLLTDSLSGFRDPGSLEALWNYQRGFMLNPGAVHGAFDLFRRFSQTLDSGEMASLIGSGLVNQYTMAGTLAQQMPDVPLKVLPRLAGALISHPALSARILPVLGRMQMLIHHYHQYPARPDLKALARWSRRTHQLMGRPDGEYPLTAEDLSKFLS